MPGNIFHFAYSQYLKDIEKNVEKNNLNISEKQNDTNYTLSNELFKNNKMENLKTVWVSRYDVVETRPSLVSKLITFLNNETFMDLIN